MRPHDLIFQSSFRGFLLKAQMRSRKDISQIQETFNPLLEDFSWKARKAGDNDREVQELSILF